MKTGDIPQNVNFAIDATVVQRFLDIHGVEYDTKASDSKMDPEEVARLARKFTVAIQCWK